MNSDIVEIEVKWGGLIATCYGLEKQSLAGAILDDLSEAFPAALITLQYMKDSSPMKILFNGGECGRDKESSIAFDTVNQTLMQFIEDNPCE